MSCERFREKVEAFVDGALEGAERQAVAEHLALCAGCQKEARALRRLHEMLGASADRAPSNSLERSFSARLRAEVKSERRRAGFWARWLSPRFAFGALAVSAAAAATILAVWWTGPSPLPGSREGERVAAADAVSPDLLAKMEMLRHLDTLEHLELLEGVTEDEFEAVSESPDLGG